LPAFVERELREFLSCGVLARGFAWFRCDGGLRLLATFDDPAAVRKILSHLGIATECPRPVTGGSSPPVSGMRGVMEARQAACAGYPHEKNLTADDEPGKP
jgi:hypothetical protein